MVCRICLIGQRSQRFNFRRSHKGFRRNDQVAPLGVVPRNQRLTTSDTGIGVYTLDYGTPAMPGVGASVELLRVPLREYS
jgi:hypothetical protein